MKVIVEPIRKGDMPYLFEARTEYFSSFWALTHTSVIPVTI